MFQNVLNHQKRNEISFKTFSAFGYALNVYLKTFANNCNVSNVEHSMKNVFCEGKNIANVSNVSKTFLT